MDHVDVATRGRIERTREWLLLDGNRLAIAGALVALLTLLLAFWPFPFPDVATIEPSLASLFTGFITGNLTLVTVVIAINQLVLSRELRTPKEMTEEIDASVAYRDDVASATDRRAGAESPTAFLDFVLSRLTESIDRLGETEHAATDPDVEREFDTVIARLDAKVSDMQPLVRERDVALFTALSVILRHSLAPEYDRCRWLEQVHGDALGDAAVGALAEAQQRIVHLEIARQYVKTLYVQVELAKLSRRLLYVGVAALTTSILAIATFSSTATVPLSVLWVAVAINVAPFAVLLVYIVRIATVAQRTAAFVPFGGTD